MIYEDILVPMPKKKALFREHPNGTTYVYFTVEAYRNAAGKSTSKVKAIGKKHKRSGKLIPNDGYFKLFPKNEHLKSTKVPSTQKKVTNNPNPISETNIIQVRSAGTAKTFYEIAKQTKLLEALQQCFPDNWEQILAAASYILSEGNTMAYIEDWFDETKVDFASRMSDVTCSRLFESITEAERQHFFRVWVALRQEHEYIAYDVTSISSYSQNIDFVEWGYNRDNEKLAQINFGMFYGMTTGIPVYYQVYSGSIPDKSSLQYMMISAKNIGINEVCFVHDQGFITEDNINHMYENSYPFITAISNSRTDVKDLIDANKGKLEKFENRVKGYDTFGVGNPFSLYGRIMRAHVYFSVQKRLVDLKELEYKIEQMQKELDAINKSNTVTKRYQDYFIIDEQSKSKLTYVLDENKIDELISRAGYLVLLSSDINMSSKDVLKIYRDKDVIEKHFDQFKNRLDFKRLKTHQTKTTEGKMFTGFVSLIMRSYMLQQINKAFGKRKPTFEKVLLELKKIKSLTMSDGQEELLALSKKQKDILTAMKVNINSL